MIETKKELKLNNLLTIRKKMTVKRVQEELVNIDNYLKEKDIERAGSVVTTTYSVEIVNNEQVIDMEILVPVSNIETLDDKYTVKEYFSLTNVVYKKHIGDPNQIQNTYNELNSYIQENGLQPITTGYNVNEKDLSMVTSIDELEVGIYIGVNPNRL